MALHRNPSRFEKVQAQKMIDMSDKVARANNNVTTNPSTDSGMYHATALHAIIQSTRLSEATAPMLRISISNVCFTTS